MFDIDVQLATDWPTPQALVLIEWAEQVLDTEQCVATALAIRLVDLDEMQRLNKTYRHKNQPTNVLAFPAEVPVGIDESYLGDIVICAPRVAEEAKTLLVEPQARWAHMVTHGVLHLLGFDHVHEADAVVMEAKESAILVTLGFKDPYD
jgi:probable rRNA maturation factor